MGNLSSKRLKKLLNYDPTTGHFSWLVDRGSAKVGAIAGRIAISFRRPGALQRKDRLITIDRKRYRASRLAWLYMTGEFSRFEIDHNDNDSLNDAFANLREATRSQNQVNTRVYRNNRLGKKGVYFRSDRNSFRAMLQVNGARLSLGHYSTAQEASAAYEAAARQHHGDFVRLG